MKLLLATPEYPISSSRASYLAMQQCATVAYFRPGDIDARNVAKLISPKRDKTVLALKTLPRGSFVATGALVNNFGNRPNGNELLVLRAYDLEEAALKKGDGEDVCV